MPSDLLLYVYIAVLCSAAGRAYASAGASAGVVLQVNTQQYAADGVHWFVEDEATTFNCSSHANVSRFVSFTSVGSQYEVDFAAIDSGLVYMKLRRDNNGSMVRCTAATPESTSTLPSSITLHLLIYQPETIRFRVNGLVVSNRYTNIGYIYYYKLGEEITVHALYRATSAPLNCILNKWDKVTGVTNKTEYEDFTNATFTINDEKKLHYLTCNSAKDILQIFQISFIKYFPNYVPVVEGLSRHSVLLQYSARGVTVLHYDVGDGTRALPLICLGYSNFTQLTYNSTSIATWLPAGALAYQFQLQPGYDIGEIECRLKNSIFGNITTVLWLIRRPTLAATSFQWVTSAATAGVLLCVVVAVAAACAVRVYRRRTHTICSSSTIMQYEELRARQPSIDDATPANYAPLYAVPGLDNASPSIVHPSSMYSNVTEKQLEPTYVNGHFLQRTESIDKLYSKPLPKSERKNTKQNRQESTHFNENATANHISVTDNNDSSGNHDNYDVTYAEISHDNSICVTSNTKP